MSRYLLGVDVGTSSLKVAVIDEDARLLGISSGKYRLVTPDPRSVQIDAQSMWDAFLSCLRDLSSGGGIDLSRVAGISISSLCPGLAALNEKGEVVVDPIIYSDRRSTEEADLILEAVGPEKLFELTGTALWLGPSRARPCSGSSAAFLMSMPGPGTSGT